MDNTQENQPKNETGKSCGKWRLISPSEGNYLQNEVGNKNVVFIPDAIVCQNVPLEANRALNTIFNTVLIAELTTGEKPAKIGFILFNQHDSDTNTTHFCFGLDRKDISRVQEFLGATEKAISKVNGVLADLGHSELSLPSRK